MPISSVVVAAGAQGFGGIAGAAGGSHAAGAGAGGASGATAETLQSIEAKDEAMLLELLAQDDAGGYIPGTCLDDFEVLDELGRGAHGVVRKVKAKKDGKLYVIKEVSVKKLKPKQRRNVVAEVLALRRLNHPNIVRFYNCFVANQTLYLVMEFAANGDMHELIQERRRQRRHFSERTLWNFLWQLCQALQHIHSKRIVHRDIKSLNVFLTEDNTIKLGDLGVSRILGRETHLQSRVGTPLYLAPELIRQESYSFKVDVWALGCVMYTLAALRSPFKGDNLLALAECILHKKPKPLPHFYTKPFATVVMAMLEKAAAKRPTVVQILDMIPPHVREQLARAYPPVEHVARAKTGNEGEFVFQHGVPGGEDDPAAGELAVLAALHGPDALALGAGAEDDDDEGDDDDDNEQDHQIDPDEDVPPARHGEGHPIATSLHPSRAPSRDHSPAVTAGDVAAPKLFAIDSVCRKDAMPDSPRGRKGLVGANGRTGIAPSAMKPVAPILSVLPPKRQSSVRVSIDALKAETQPMETVVPPATSNGIAAGIVAPVAGHSPLTIGRSQAAPPAVVTGGEQVSVGAPPSPHQRPPSAARRPQSASRPGVSSLLAPGTAPPSAAAEPVQVPPVKSFWPSPTHMPVATPVRAPSPTMQLPQSSAAPSTATSTTNASSKNGWLVPTETPRPQTGVAMAMSLSRMPGVTPQAATPARTPGTGVGLAVGAPALSLRSKITPSAVLVPAPAPVPAPTAGPAPAPVPTGAGGWFGRPVSMMPTAGSGPSEPVKALPVSGMQGAFRRTPGAVPAAMPSTSGVAPAAPVAAVGAIARPGSATMPSRQAAMTNARLAKSTSPGFTKADLADGAGPVKVKVRQFVPPAVASKPPAPGGRVVVSGWIGPI